ncbi:T9SS type A sorting domain-containing protein, partial [Candidatus Fermentibacteria bacterium]|nr:T9SS type A sorting domain-containing protein [Candidatus Fermentibacteria bacterium]
GVGDAWTRFTIEDGAYSRFVCFAHINGDDHLDVVARRSGTGLAWWESTTWPPDSQWVRHVVTNVDRNYELFVVDFDQDGDMDILYPCYDSPTGLVLFENLDGAGTTWGELTVSNNRFTWTSAHAADIDGDGDFDVAACNEENSPYPGMGLYWYENLDGQGDQWEEHILAYDLDEAEAVHATDLTNDGFVDIICVQHGDQDVLLFENLDGAGEEWARHVVGPVSIGYDVDAADFDEDGLTDILAVGYTSIYWYSVSRFDYGWLESSILDVRGYPQWDSLTWIATEPSGTDMYFRVRSSNDPEELGAWSDPIQSQGSLAGYMDSTHRFMQYRVHMESPERSGTPFIDRVVFYYSNLGVEEEEEGSFLLQVVPNPSAGSATVRFELLEEADVELGIYDLAGRLVRIPAKGPHSSGLHEVVVSDLPSGVYVARLRAGGQLVSERFAVVK